MSIQLNIFEYKDIGRSCLQFLKAKVAYTSQYNDNMKLKTEYQLILQVSKFKHYKTAAKLMEMLHKIKVG